jgi:hypothetical protein
MALYVSIDEGYLAKKLSSLDSVVNESKHYTLQDGRKITKKIAKDELKLGSFNLYDYDKDDLAEALENGSVRGIDWALKIQTL